MTPMAEGDSAILPLASGDVRINLPRGTEILAPTRVSPLSDPYTAIRDALARPIGTPRFSDLARQKLATNPEGRAVIVISDSTRPVPYSGPSGILWPLVEQLLGAGYRPEMITVLIATGTHRTMSEQETAAMIDPRVVQAGLAIRCHDAFSEDNLSVAGGTRGGRMVRIDRIYLEADFRILTGLVESHFMAGASGGRKSICPGLIGIDSIRDFHGPGILGSPRATDLVMEGNPCHELALEVADMAPADFILNVTAREDAAVVGVFAGDMKQAHSRAVDHLCSFARIPLARRYDIVLTHAGKVGVNHYQAAKAAAVAARAVRRGGYIVVVADTTDLDPVGSAQYRALMTLLRDVGASAFERLIRSRDWTFLPDQWEVQMWARLFTHISPSHLLYFSPQTPLVEYERLPCRSPRAWTECVRDIDVQGQIAAFVRHALLLAATETMSQATDVHSRAKKRIPHGSNPTVAYLPAGPYGIPVGAEND